MNCTQAECISLCANVNAFIAKTIKGVATHFEGHYFAYHKSERNSAEILSKSWPVSKAHITTGFGSAPPVVWLSKEPLYEVESILDHYVTKPRGRAPAKRPALTKYLVKWAGYDHLHNSWENESNLVNCAEALADYWQRTNATKPTTR